jgi:hypothetical protein
VIRATSLSHKAGIRREKKTRAWENIRLSAIAKQIAQASGMKTMFISDYDPLYPRVEQDGVSDVRFLKRLCRRAGIALKVTNETIVLFDEQEFERKKPALTIRRGWSDVVTYRFSTNLNDTVYGRCHVFYTDTDGKTIEYTYTPNDSDPDAPTLEINEKVTDRGSARNLAMRRLRQKNKQEFSAAFTLVGDIKYAAGATVQVAGWGVFDGKHIIERAVHNVTASGFTTQLTLRRCGDN